MVPYGSQGKIGNFFITRDSRQAIFGVRVLVGFRVRDRVSVISPRHSIIETGSLTRSQDRRLTCNFGSKKDMYNPPGDKSSVTDGFRTPGYNQLRETYYLLSPSSA